MEIWGDVEGDGETAAVLPYLRTYPQGFAQLLPGEGACVTFYTLESLERGCMVEGDFSTALRSARNDSSTRTVVL